MESSIKANNSKVLVIGVEEALDPQLGSELATEFDVEVAFADVFDDPQNCSWATSFDALVLDVGSTPNKIAKHTTQQVLACLLDRDPVARLITRVRDKDHEAARAAIEAGACDVVFAGDDGETLREKVRAVATLRALDDRFPSPAASGANAPQQMVGVSDAMCRVFELIRRVATTDAPVLLTGESGTGKELAALAIHERSQRGGGPFVPINCAAIAETLLESELFGHERGAFTGAMATRRGKVEFAHGGTLFLDEVGEMALSVQAKLLRFLEDQVVERVGGRERIQLDVRVISATNRNLASAVERGGFRKDLFYRLAVVGIDLPPLRDRPEDVLLMARFYLDRYARESGRNLRFSGDGLNALRNARWSGNVRELVNRIRRAVVMTNGPLVTPADLGFDGSEPVPPMLTLREARAEAEINCIRQALEATVGNRSEAAHLLGISRSKLYELLRRHDFGCTDDAQANGPSLSS